MIAEEMEPYEARPPSYNIRTLEGTLTVHITQVIIKFVFICFLFNKIEGKKEKKKKKETNLRSLQLKVLFRICTLE
jgi:hypothetical protein